MSSTLSAVPGGSFSYDANDRLTTDTYDNNGNTTASGTNIYDFENRLVTHGAVTIAYDGDGNRVSETVGGVTTKFLVDDKNPTRLSQVLDELINGSVTRTYAYGLQRISENQQISGNWTPRFYGYDGHGDVRFLMNSAGAITDTYQYDAFGNQIATTGTTANNFLYSGEQYDSSLGSLYLRARYYRLPTGRFLTIDPYEGDIRNPATLHKYVYARNNPVNLSDPSGRQVVIEVSLVYILFDIRPARRISPKSLPPYGGPFDPAELGEELPSAGFERLHNFAFARKLGSCLGSDPLNVKQTPGFLQTVADLLGNPQTGPSTAEAGEEYLKCLLDAFEEELSPIPFLPLPL